MELGQCCSDTFDFVVDSRLETWMFAFGYFLLKVLVARLDEHERTP